MADINTGWYEQFARDARRAQSDSLAQARTAKILGDWRGRVEHLNTAWRMRAIARETEAKLKRWAK